MTKPTLAGTLRLPPKPPKAKVLAPQAAPKPKAGRAAVPAVPPRKSRPTQHLVPSDTMPSNATVAVGERLSKRVAHARLCSRSEAEQYIAGGWVQVDGTVVEEPQTRVLQHQTVTVDPHASLLEQTPVTLLLHKPADWVDGSEESLSKLNRKARRTPFDDARSLLVLAKHVADDPTDRRVLQRHFRQLSCDVPLENAASGLIVFTQDWRIQRKLTEERGTMEHELMVDIEGAVSPETLLVLNRLVKSDPQLPLVKISISSTTPERSKLRFAIKGAHRGLIAYLCGQAQLTILDMRRTRLGRIALSDLPVGHWRYLGPHEKF